MYVQFKAWYKNKIGATTNSWVVIYLFQKYLLSIYYIPGIALGTRILEEQIRIISTFMRFTF